MDILFGRAALTTYQLERLRAQTEQLSGDISLISAHYFYCVHTSSKLNSQQLNQLRYLLSCDDIADVNIPCSVWVTPRLGTVSSWCTKAVDIVRHCALSAINRIERGIVYRFKEPVRTHLTEFDCCALEKILSDRMTESVFYQQDDIQNLFKPHSVGELVSIDLLGQGIDRLTKANHSMGLALSDDEINYLYHSFVALKRNPTDAELMMFAQVNSEHCRHKIFNARWFIDGAEQPNSLFSMIRHTYAQSPDAVISAYSDNAAVLKGSDAHWFYPHEDHCYKMNMMPAHIVLKVETHNHPCAISPYPGAATGSGGEIRDEAATGIGARPVAGLCGFSVSHLNIPDFTHAWETNVGKPDHIVSALDIMLQAPLGAASFNNEFGRPNVLGYFRSFGLQVDDSPAAPFRGYHKPIMLAGGIGMIAETQTAKKTIPVGSLLVVLGGPALAIGLGGGSASSKSAGDSSQQSLDFSSVQRSNPEMQRRVQELINHCWAKGDDNPILNIHDVGAGGLSNALPELIEASEGGGQLDLAAIISADDTLSPMELWCNEAQERFVLAIKAERIDELLAHAKRERCPVCVVGTVTSKSQLLLSDSKYNQAVVDMPLATLFEKMPRLDYKVGSLEPQLTKFDTAGLNVSETCEQILQFPAVADKSFLIHIGDRSVGGLVTQDQMVGPWQIPVSDVAVTCADFTGLAGSAMALGERAPLALISPAAAARIAVGEALTNLAAARIKSLTNVSLSANWMAAANEAADGAGLYEAVKAIGIELCPALGMAIPVGKDSLSMRMQWQENGNTQAVSSPISPVITAAAPVLDVRKTLTPQLHKLTDSVLMLIDLGRGRCALGGSVLAQIHGQLGSEAPDVDDPLLLRNFFATIQSLNEQDLIQSYHDRSDGGLFATICEMAFAGQCGVDINFDSLADDPVAGLFNEELGAVIQIKQSDQEAVDYIFKMYQLTNCVHNLGTINEHDRVSFNYGGKEFYSSARCDLHALWSKTSYHIRMLRDNPDCVQQEFDMIKNDNIHQLTPKLSFDVSKDIVAPFVNTTKPRIAILREQGVNGHVEMAAAFDRVGFECLDITMSDLIECRQSIDDCVGLVACGGFSYGDVLGAGRGWAQSILCNMQLRAQFSRFFSRSNTFSLGVCNGCQMLAQLKELIPGAEHWPEFKVNQSRQFEARLVQVMVDASPSILLADMQGSVIPVVASHGEGRVARHVHSTVTLRYVNSQHQSTENYPANPNGSVAAVAGVCSDDGRVNIMMPHPERLFRAVQFSWAPKEWGVSSPWLRIFANARRWVG